MKKLVHSLGFKILLLCMGLVLTSALTIQYFAYKAAESSVERTIGKMAITITSSVVGTIDADQYEQLATTKDINNEYYAKLKQELINIRIRTGLKFLYTMSETEDGKYIYVVDGADAGSDDESVLGDVEEDISSSMLGCFQGESNYEFSSEDWGSLISGFIPIKNSSGKVIGILGADFDASTMVDQLKKANIKMFNIALIVILCSIFLALIFSILLIRSIKRLQANVDIIKNGDLTVKTINNHKDEIGSLSKAFQQMIENMSEMIRNIRDKSDKALVEVDSLNSSVDITNRTTEEITRVVGEIAIGAASQVENANEVEEAMNRVFVEIEHITDNIESVSYDSDTCISQMHEASTKLDSTVEQINLVNDTVDSTAILMKQLEDKFREVLSFSDIVSAISKQTNLLALNASIEAASAGEHGKGFMVVATEIKNLAKQSSDASRRINELITAVKEEIDHSGEAIQNGVLQARSGVNEMSEVKHYLDRLSESNRKMNSKIKEVATAISHIEDDSRNVTDKISDLSRIAKEFNAGTQQTSAETQEQYAIMEGIKNELTNVKAIMDELRGTVNQFKINE